MNDIHIMIDVGIHSTILLYISADLQKSKLTSIVHMNGNGNVDQEQDSDSGLLTARDSLSHEVFSNLPEDLQEMLKSSPANCMSKLYILYKLNTHLIF